MEYVWTQEIVYQEGTPHCVVYAFCTAWKLVNKVTGMLQMEVEFSDIKQLSYARIDIRFDISMVDFNQLLLFIDTRMYKFVVLVGSKEINYTEQNYLIFISR